jgi:hypothetical protein
MTGIRTPNTAVMAEGRRGKNDRNKNTLAPLVLLMDQISIKTLVGSCYTLYEYMYPWYLFTQGRREGGG